MNTTSSVRVAGSAAPDSRKGVPIGQLLRRPEAGSLLGMVAVFAFFAILGGSTFLSPAGYASWLNIAAEIGIVALPIGLLMIAGEMDLSIGAVIPAASLTVAIVSGHYGISEIVGIAAGLGVGVVVGLINGVMVNRTGVPSLIVTIATMFGVMGLTLGFTVLIAGSTGVSLVPGPTAKALLGQFIGGMFEVTIFWWVLFAAIFFYLLHVSPIGNWIFAMGGDKVSARNAGIPTGSLTVALYVLSGVSAAFVGVSQVLVYQSAQVLAGQSFIFNSIMCVVIGGVLLTGGAGSVIGIVIGTLTFSIVNQGIYFTGIDPNIGSVIIGALLLLAVMTNDRFRLMAMAYAAKKKA
jgi:simple sugar transport system permease protein